MVYDGIIEGIGVNLRSVTEDDAEFTYQLRQDKERTKFLHSVSGTVEDQRNWIRSQRAREGDYYFVVEDKKGKPLGTVGYYDIVGVNGETGRLVINGNTAQNCDAILQLRKFAFEIIGAEHIRCTTVNGNKTMMAQLKRFGAEQVGTEIDEKDGFELLVYRVTREAYEAGKEKYRKLVEKSYQLLEQENTAE
ncbi:MAG: GNAT family N-acetyltransferase [Acutalibacteraceae bacterium]|nr:GNAT family N-acetyltransferase [Acutalibacteraceae bacterium]